MPRLVALDMPGGPAFLEAFRRVLDDGDAAFVIDQRLASAPRKRLLAAMAPAIVVDGSGDEHVLAGSRPVEEGDALVVATSGTTGEAKGVVLTLDAVAASARATSERLAVDPRADRWCCCLPLAHVGGLSVVTRAVLTATPVDVLDRFDAQDVQRCAETRGATLVSLVPTTLGRLGTNGAAKFRVVVLGGSAPPAERAANVVATYGMTETGSGVVYDGVPLEGVEIRTTASGEIELRGPMLLRAYRDGSDPRDEEGWLPTGDAGHIGDDGRLEVLGRLRDLVVSGGENVWPEQLEQVLCCHPEVSEIAVTGAADPEWGERVVAYVVTTNGVVPALGELRALATEHIGPWAAPRELVIVDKLPRSAIGKLRRSALGESVASARIMR